jgi:threonine/homoserine/homoserine lactone efflux protein
MMGSIVYIKGLIVGIIMCAPFGPIGLLCLRKTFIDGRLAGAISVLGASTVDGLYCTIAGLGLTWMADFLVKEKMLIQMVGSLVLIVAGVLIYFIHARDGSMPRRSKGLLGAFSSTFFLMLGNPMPVLVFTATFAALGMHGRQGDYLHTALLASGVFSGSALWAPIFAVVRTLFQPRFDAPQIRIVNRASGFIVFVFGLGMGLMSLIR